MSGAIPRTAGKCSRFLAVFSRHIPRPPQLHRDETPSIKSVEKQAVNLAVVGGAALAKEALFMASKSMMRFAQPSWLPRQT